MKNTKIPFLLLLGCLVADPSFAFYVQDGNIYDDNNKLVSIDGVSWSGFQDSGMLQGLSSNPFYAPASGVNSPKSYGMMDALVHPENYTDSGVKSNASVSFKTVRMPIQPGLLYDTDGKASFNLSISNKDTPTTGNGVFCKTWESNGTHCQTPVSSAEAFWTTLKEMQKNHVNVLVDFHHRYGYGDQYRDGTVYDLTQYQADIKALIAGLKSRNLNNVIGIDVFNEPWRLQWFQKNGDQSAWVTVIAKAAETVYANNPNLLLFVEGAGGGSNDPDQPVTCVKTSELTTDNDAYTISDDPGHCATGTKRVDFRGNWGEDFKPLLSKSGASKGEPTFDRTLFIQKLKENGLSDKAITWLMGDENGKGAHIVFSPHVYPKEVAGWESQPGASSNLRFDWTWGFLQKAGYPVVLGESSWKTQEGKDFFQKALVPYLTKYNMTSNLFFWAIGYLGDTVSLIDPNSGSVNQDAEKILHDLYQQNVNTGTVTLSFTNPGFPLTGDTVVTVKETSEQTTCAFSGCRLTLDSGDYHISVAPRYALDATSYDTYLLKPSSAAFQIHVTASQSTPLKITLDASQVGQAPMTKLDDTFHLLDETQKSLAVSGLEGTIIQLTNVKDQSLQTTCTLSDDGHCKVDIYNTSLDPIQGTYASQTWNVLLPNNITLADKGYTLQREKSDTMVTVTSKDGSQALNAYYQTNDTTQNNDNNNNNNNNNTLPPDSGASSGQCRVELTLQNSWDGGAVFQGTLVNTGKNPMKHFTIHLTFGKTVTTPSIVNQWVGNNTEITASSPGEFQLKGDTYDSYNGIASQQNQTIGFEISGTLNGTPSVQILSCEGN